VDLLSYIKNTLNQNKASNITEINVDESFSEFEKIIIASGTSTRQVVALAEKVREGVKGLFRINCKIEGKENADWILLDFGAVIVHIFKPEVREYYQIEKMWKGYLTEISS
jgi:ribosome-associated protein|tara:strand:- start:1003 stop:1335 length:333 start_codon:yes stop_codon:yes gene_type:complete